MTETSTGQAADPAAETRHSSRVDARTRPTLAGLIFGWALVMMFGVADEDTLDAILYGAVFVGFFAALLGDDRRPAWAFVGWFANSLAFWSALLLIVEAGGLNLVLSLLVVVIAMTLIGVVAFTRLLSTG